jgi:hypothetical protein
MDNNSISVQEERRLLFFVNKKKNILKIVKHKCNSTLHD